MLLEEGGVLGCHQPGRRVKAGTSIEEVALCGILKGDMEQIHRNRKGGGDGSRRVQQQPCRGSRAGAGVLVNK